MMHGTALTSGVFKDVRGAFENEYHVAFPDLRGHGQSSWHSAAVYRHDDCVGDFGVIRNAMGWTERMSIVGHSISGLHAARYAAQHPEEVAALVLVDVVPTVDNSVVEHLFEFVLTDFPSFEAALEAAQRLSPGREEAEIAASLRELMIWDEGREIFRYRSDPAFLREFAGSDLSEFWDDLGRVQCPVLLAQGGESRLLTPEAVARFQRLLPNAEVYQIPGARHTVMADNPADFARVVKQFLDRVRDRP
jgi:pimeloyl-ACP methyl ester carboxylesterase